MTDTLISVGFFVKCQKICHINCVIRRFCEQTSWTVTQFVRLFPLRQCPFDHQHWFKHLFETYFVLALLLFSHSFALCKSYLEAIFNLFYTYFKPIFSYFIAIIFCNALLFWPYYFSVLNTTLNLFCIQLSLSSKAIFSLFFVSK